MADSSGIFGDVSEVARAGGGVGVSSVFDAFGSEDRARLDALLLAVNGLRADLAARGDTTEVHFRLEGPAGTPAADGLASPSESSAASPQTHAASVPLSKKDRPA